jgi:hypothetical protein
MTENVIAEITARITQLRGARFASLTYLSKKHGELARYTANFGFTYAQVLEKSKLELELLIAENTDKWDAVTKEAAAELMASFNESIEKHAKGEQNSAYTKKGQYVPLGNGVNLNSTDNTIQLFGLVLTKTVLVEGTYPVVNSAPKTIAKNKLRKMLPIGKFREFALDEWQVAQMKINGDTIEIPEWETEA